ncbi:hypothetical protein Scep_023072 [Stephania cephalantha]|uniref:non-specific serine/threonine protein kinase n=1 Tax=Stephania cephalantha TaxID=152367 RepID=A0AAP0HYD3_9MAGN
MDHLLLWYMITTFVAAVSILKPVLSANSLFKACEPKKCGENVSVEYPFWISSQQPSSCGNPFLEINCVDDKHPTIKLSVDHKYVILDINYENGSLLVADADAFDETVCVAPSDNFTLSEEMTMMMSLSPYDLHLYFFYDCKVRPTDYPTFSIPCGVPKSNSHNFAALLHNSTLNYLNASAEKCESFVAAPVYIDEGVLDPGTIERVNYTSILQEGFLLNWSLNTSSSCDACRQSGGLCGQIENQFMCFCSDHNHTRSCDDDGKNKGLKIGIGIGTGVGGIILGCMAFLIWQRRKKVRSISSTLLSRNISPEPSSKPDIEKGDGMLFSTPIFTYNELVEATEDFDESKELGDGGFGTVYHGKLRDGREVAVKRLYEHNYKRVEQFMNEISILSRLRHKYLVSLYGCTSRDSRELLLVYEFVSNGTVADHLHGNHAKAGHLTWPIRMSIAIESADALTYLHATEIIHRDVKTNNILLDKEFHVKVADFGLSRLFPTDVTHVSTAPQGTPGYVDPEYYQCYQLNDRSDVYSFGVVLIELISSKPAVDINRHRHEINLASMAINKIVNHALHELVDPSLGYESDYEVRRMVTSVAELAFRCLQQEKEMRPTMKEVLESLKSIEDEKYKREMKGEELGVGPEKGVLKAIDPPLSPDSVTDKWASINTTPNTSA